MTHARYNCSSTHTLTHPKKESASACVTERVLLIIKQILQLGEDLFGRNWRKNTGKVFPQQFLAFYAKKLTYKRRDLQGFKGGFLLPLEWR